MLYTARKTAAARSLRDSSMTRTSLPWFSTTRTRSAARIQTVAVLSLGVDPNDAACEIGVQKDRRLPSLVVEKLQGRHGTRLEPHNGPKVVGRRKRERARTVPSPELLKVDAPVAHERYEVVGALLVVAHKEVLGVAVGVRQLDRLELRHAVGHRVPSHPARDTVRVEVVVSPLFVHHHAPPPVSDSRIVQREGAVDVGAFPHGRADGQSPFQCMNVVT